jgi:drug/metabolite transporter (DMT)-like permease
MTSTRTRVGLLALAVTFSAGIHAALVPEHLEEMPRLGYAFAAAAAVGAVLAVALVARSGDRRIPAVAGLFCLGQIAAWALFVTVPLPGFSGRPEPIEAIALVSKAVELAAVLLAFPIALPRPRRFATSTAGAA